MSSDRLVEIGKRKPRTEPPVETFELRLPGGSVILLESTGAWCLLEESPEDTFTATANRWAERDLL